MAQNCEVANAEPDVKKYESLDKYSATDKFCVYEIIQLATKKGDIDTLNKWKMIIFKVIVNENLISEYIDLASQYSQITVLKWWRDNYTSEFQCPYNAINYAFLNKQIDILEWWEKSGLKWKYSIEVYTRFIKHIIPEIIDNTEKISDLNILTRWKKMIYYFIAIETISDSTPRNDLNIFERIHQTKSWKSLI